MNHTLHAQSLYHELWRSHVQVCPLRNLHVDLLKHQLSDFNHSDTIKMFSSLINIWQPYISGLTQDDHTLDGFFLLCTQDGYVIDINDPRCQSRLIAKQSLLVGKNFFRLLSRWEKAEWSGQASISASDICAHPILPEFCAAISLYAVLSPLSTIIHPDVGAVMVFVTPYITSLTVPLIRTIARSIEQAYSHEMAQQANAFIQDAFLSHLDCHMILLNQNGEIAEEIHPIKLDSTDSNQMYKLMCQEGFCSPKQVIGDRVYQVSISRYNQASQSSQMTLGLFRDITRMEQYADRLRDLEKFSSLVTLSAGIAHEIRNPLTTARGFLQLFLKRSDSSSDRQFLTLTIAELDRIQILLRDFMNISKPDLKNRQPVNIVTLVREVVHFMNPEASLKNVELEYAISLDCATVEADEGQIKQVFINILQNAVQACEKRGFVMISAKLKERQICIQFSDTGCGIADTTQLFHPFYTTKETGTGLGLVVSKHIIEEHRGNIEIDSTVGAGTTVNITLPLSNT